jgi:hypothetical protein
MKAGDRFGRWLVFELLPNYKALVICECGARKSVRRQYLKDGSSKSCGCWRVRDQADDPVEVEARYERLIVVQRLGNARGHKVALVKCDCGNFKVVREDGLRKGYEKSCGCFRREDVARRSRTHGETRTPLYRSWEGAKRRCINPIRYPSYVGISMHLGWVNNYEAFRDYVNENLGPRPLGYSLDRIDNRKGYEPSNLQWANAKDQANNRKYPVQRKAEDRRYRPPLPL